MNISKRDRPLVWVALAMSLVCYTVVFVITVTKYTQRGFIEAISFMPEHPGAFFEFMAEAFAAAFWIPLLLIPVSLIFKKTRNLSAACYIIIVSQYLMFVLQAIINGAYLK